jgi:uncharacterized protein
VMSEAVMDDLEIHPGVAEFWQEHDVWDDSWTEGEAD